MTPQTVLLGILLVAAIAACVALVWVSREAVLTLRRLRLFADDTSDRLIPLLEKADVTVDAANAELLRLDGAITRFEEAGERVSQASATISDVVQAPAEIVTGVADRVRKAWKERKQDAPGKSSAPTDAQNEADDDTEPSPATTVVDMDAPGAWPAAGDEPHSEPAPEDS